MPDSKSAFPQLNPSTPQVFLDPKTAMFREAYGHVVTVTLGIYLWDILTNIGSDYKLLSKYKLQIPTVMYFVSRMMTLSFLISSTVFAVGGIGHCLLWNRLTTISYSMSVVSTSFLFFVRAKAIFYHNRRAVIFFLFALALVTASVMLLPLAVFSSNIGPTKYCIITRISYFSYGVIVTPLLYDTSIFIAVSYRIISINAFHESTKDKWNAFFGRLRMSNLTRALLQGSQQYYLVSIVTNVLLLFFGLILYRPYDNSLSTMSFATASVALQNGMACIAFRHIKFSLTTEDISIISSVHFGDSSSTTISHISRVCDSSPDISCTERTTETLTAQSSTTEPVAATPTSENTAGDKEEKA